MTRLEQTNTDELIDFNNAIAESPLTPSQGRWALFHREQNGLAPAVRKIGKRIYLRRNKWKQWLLTGKCE